MSAHRSRRQRYPFLTTCVTFAFGLTLFVMWNVAFIRLISGGWLPDPVMTVEAKESGRDLKAMGRESTLFRAESAKIVESGKHSVEIPLVVQNEKRDGLNIRVKGVPDASNWQISQDGTFVWSPKAGEEGFYRLTFTVTDEYQVQSQKDYDVIVHHGKPPSYDQLL